MPAMLQTNCAQTDPLGIQSGSNMIFTIAAATMRPWSITATTPPQADADQGVAPRFDTARSALSISLPMQHSWALFASQAICEEQPLQNR